MKGYMSFLLVFVSVLFVIYLLNLRISSEDFELSKALVVQRAYYLQMNVKETVIETVKQDAIAGFSTYNKTHDVDKCKHCSDNFCSPLPLTLNHCDHNKCLFCFREAEAREAARKNAVKGILSLNSHQFESSYVVSLSKPVLSIRLTPNRTEHNGFSFGNILFEDDFNIAVNSEHFQISAEGMIPRGCTIYGKGPSNC